MCKVDGIEVTCEDRPAWDAAVTAFQRNLRGKFVLIRDAAANSLPTQLSIESGACPADPGAISRA